MLAMLTEQALARRGFVLAAALALVAWGVSAFRDLPIDAFPDVSSTQVKLILKAPGMTPEEVEARVTQPIETELLGIPHQTVLRSLSKNALADVTVDFAEGTDIYWARQQVAERYANVAGELPDNVSGGLAPIATPLSELFMFTVEGPLSLAEKRALLDWTIRPLLRALPGVADVNALGGHVATYAVTPDPAALAARGVQLAELRHALDANLRNDGAGRVAEGEEAWVVRIDAGVRALSDLAGIGVKTVDGIVVTVGDVARVEAGALTRYGAVTENGRGETVQGIVVGLKGVNADALLTRVKARLAEIEASLPAGTTLAPFYDRSALVDRAIATVSTALAEAAVLVTLMLVLFLGNLRAALVVAAILPLSVLATFVLMRHAGLSANLMSLGGLAIAIGLLVDAAVVVVENVVAHLAHDPDSAPSGPNAVQRVLRAVQEVATPVVSGMLIIAIVFLPLLTLEGLEGKLFAPVALTIVFALAASLLLALTVIPVLASYFLKQAAHTDPWLLRRAQALYTPLLDRALARPGVVYAVAGLLVAGAAATWPFVGKSFMPTMDEGDILVQLEKLPSVNLDASLEIDLAVQRALLAQVPEIRRIVARTGADELGLDPMSLNETDSFLVLKPVEEWRRPDKDWLADQIRSVLEDFPGVAYTFTQPIDMRVSEMLTGARGDVAIKLFGPDLATLNRLGEAVLASVSRIPGASDPYAQASDGVQYLTARVDREAATRFGLAVDDIAALLQSQLEGEILGNVQVEGRRVPVQMRGPAALRHSPDALQTLTLSLPDGRVIGLDQVATLERGVGPVAVKRENAARFVVVQTNVAGRDLVGFVADAQAAVAREVPLPPGYRLAWGGQFENQQRAAARLMWVVPAALAAIAVLLYLTFSSVRQAVLVLANVPLALVGGVFALALSGQYVSVPASVGFIALLGIAVLNGVVLVSHFNQLRAQGRRGIEIVREGALRRLRPVLMTASIAALGLVPLLFASGPGSEIQRPLASVVIGGLVSSTLLTLVLLPLLYRRFILGHEASSQGSSA